MSTVSLIESCTLSEMMANCKAGHQPGLLEDQIRQNAASSFLESGIPEKKHEDWRFSDLKTLSGKFVSADENADMCPVMLAEVGNIGTDCDRFVFVNGVFRKDLSDISAPPDGALITNMKSLSGQEECFAKLSTLAQKKNPAFSACNTALLKDGLVIHLNRGTVVKKPVHLISIAVTDDKAVIVNPRLLVIAEEGSSVTIVESHSGSSNQIYFSNSISEFFIDENAKVEHLRIQRDGNLGNRVSGLFARLETKSSFKSHTVTLGGKMVRNGAEVELAGEYANTEINGLYLLENEQHVDNHTEVYHQVPNCQSAQIFRGVLDNKSKGVFTGRVFVLPDAQKSDAQQNNSTLLLSDDARSWARPELEVYADDVKCAHGATTGSLDEDALFYLRSRGVDIAHARRLLIHAFASELIARIGNYDLIPQLDRLVTRTLRADY
jgi:Fe-S cluster assembly protein SufD